MTDTKPLSEQKELALSERKMAVALIEHLRNLGYIAVTELVLNDKLFDIKSLTGKNLRKVRIDVAAYKDGKITFIEVENGLWLTHPVLYRNFAHYLMLAYPEEFSSPTDKEQVKMAKLNGIGIISVSNNGSIKATVRPLDFDISENISKGIISLINKRMKGK